MRLPLPTQARSLMKSLILHERCGRLVLSHDEHSVLMSTAILFGCAQASMEGRQQPPPFGALMFSCNGRGQNLYREENYDSRTLAAFVPVPFSGMFCNGELFPSSAW